MPDQFDESVSIEVAVEQGRVPVVQFANHLLTQFDGETYFLHFCQLQPPLLDAETAKRKIEGMSVKAEPVAGIAVTPDKLRDFIKVLQSQMARIEKRQQDSRNRESDFESKVPK